MACPSCGIELAETKLALGRFWSCDKCGGRAITVELLRRIFTPESINPLWLHAISNEGQLGRPCPLCSRQMLTVGFADAISPPIDLCRLCHLVWFDRGEIESLTPRPSKPGAAPVAPEQRQAIAIAKVAAMAEEARAEDYGKIWQQIGKVFGGRLRSGACWPQL